MVCDKTKKLKIPILLSALYSTHVNFPFPTYFQTFLSNSNSNSISQDMFSDLISLSLFLRLGIQLRFTASMPVSLFTATQICYHQCEAKMMRSQIGVRSEEEFTILLKKNSQFFSSTIYIFTHLIEIISS